MKTLMNNTIVGFAFGLILTMLFWGIFILSGEEPYGAGGLALFTSMIAVVIKEAINHFVVNSWSNTVLLYGFGGSITGGLIALLLA